MITLITIFYISLICMILMLLMKRREIMTGKQSIFSKIGANSDHIFNSVYMKARNILSYVNKHTFVALANWIAYHILLRVRKIYVEIKSKFLENPHGKKLIDAVRGRGDVKNHGASFYLRRISNNQIQK